MRRFETKWRRLLRNRSAHLEPRPVRSIVKALGRLSLAWLDRRSVFRKKALRRLVVTSGYNEKMAERLLDGLFKELTEKKLLSLLRAEFRDYRALDGFRRDAVTGQKTRAYGPSLITHVFSGNTPNPAVQSLVFGMLLKSANIAKPASGDEGIAGLYLESLKQADPKLASTNLLLAPRDRTALKQALSSAEVIAAYGNDATMEDLRKELTSRQQFFAYGHRTSFSLVTRRALGQKNAQILAKKVAFDAWLADRRGCLSPAVVFAQKGGVVSPRRFAELVSQALSRSPRGKKEHLLRLHAGHFTGGGWSVLYDEKIKYPLDEGPVLRVKGFSGLDAVEKALSPLFGYFQCAALEAQAAERERAIQILTALRVPRVCRAGRMQLPPVAWHHDGKPNLASWVHWTDLES